MKTILISLVLGFVALHSSFGQTLKNLTYNASNGQVIYSGTNPLTFTNPLQFTTNTRATTRTNLSLGATWLTNPLPPVYVDINGNLVTSRTNILNVTNTLNIDNSGITLTNCGIQFRNQTNYSAFGYVDYDGSSFYLGVTVENKGLLVLRPSGVALFTPLQFEGTNAAVNRATTRTNLGLGTAATNASTDFQPASANLTNLASNNAINLTNFPALLLRTNSSAAGLTGFPTLNQNTTGTASNVTGVVALTNGGTGTNSAGGARTNLGLGATWLTNTNAANFRSAIGLGSWAELNDGAQVRVESLNISDGEQPNYTQFTTAGVFFNGGNDLQFREALWLGTNNAVTFSNITARGTLAVTGNVTMSGTGNLAPSQAASSGASLMTRDLIYQSQMDFNSGDPVGAQSAIATGTGAFQGGYLTFGHAVQVTTNTNTAAGVYFGDAIWNQASFSGGAMPANKAIDLTMKGVMLRVESNTNFVNRVAFGVGAATRTPPAAGNPAATNQSWGVNFFYNGTNQVYQPFWYTTNYNTGPTGLVPELATGSWLALVYTMRFTQTTNGQISFYVNNGRASRLSSTPTWTTNVTWPSTSYGGRYIGMECATATNAAPVAGARMHYRNAYIKYDP